MFRRLKMTSRVANIFINKNFLLTFRDTSLLVILSLLKFKFSKNENVIEHINVYNGFNQIFFANLVLHFCFIYLFKTSERYILLLALAGCSIYIKSHRTFSQFNDFRTLKKVLKYIIKLFCCSS